MRKENMHKAEVVFELMNLAGFSVDSAISFVEEFPILAELLLRDIKVGLRQQKQKNESKNSL